MSSASAADVRRARGMAIASVCKIVECDGAFTVPSQTGNGFHRVQLGPSAPSCSCPDFAERGEPCKHVYAVRFHAGLEPIPEEAVTIPLPATVAVKQTRAPRPTYKQAWPAYVAAQVNEKDKLQALLADLCRAIPEPTRTEKDKGGQRPVPMADRAFACALKVYTTVSGRRASCDLRAAQERGHLSVAPHYSSVTRYLEDPGMTSILRSLIAESAKPLIPVESHFIVDSTGFTTSRFVRWFDHKYGVVKQEHDWVKVSVCTGRTTNVVTAVLVGERDAADCPTFAPLLYATAARGFRLREVSADTAFASYDNFELVHTLGGVPYIAFREGTSAAKGGIFGKMFHLYNFNREDYLRHYHKRSNVETTFSMIKAKFGDALRSKTDAAMVNEAMCKILNHNICCLIQSHYELGIDPVFWGREAKAPAEPVAADQPATDDVEMWAWV